MANALCAQPEPYAFEVEAGKRYAWCACGRSDNQPLCDGAHGDCGIKPNVFTAEKTETVYLCGCKATNKPPFCDGSHNRL